MNIEQSTVRKLKITDVEGLDPVTVILEDIEPRKGKIIIECYGESWSSYWGGMGNQTISEFFRSCDNQYLIGYLAPSVHGNITDEIAITDDVKSRILKLRRERELSKDEAEDLWFDCEYSGVTQNDHAILQRVYGEEWWHCLPERPNPYYEYLVRICNAVKEALSAADHMPMAA